MQKRLNLTRDFYGVSINIISGGKPWKNGWQFRESDVIALLLTNRHLDPTLLSLTTQDERRSDVSSRPIDMREPTRSGIRRSGSAG